MRRSWARAAAGWLHRKDPAGRAVRRSVRAAVVLPCAFGLTHAAFSDAQVSLLAGFGSFALLLLVEFPGKRRTRLWAYVALFVVGAGLVSLGTVLSEHKVAAVVAMAVIGFAVLYAGVASPLVATGSTATLLLFVLPVAVSAPPSEVGARLLGWSIAGALCIPACLLVWPPPLRDDLRRRLSATITAIGRLAGAHAAGRPDPTARRAMDTELTSLRRQLADTPYQGSGAAIGAVTLASLAGRVEWAATNASLLRDDPTTLDVPSSRSVLSSVADTLFRSAALVCDGNANPVDDPALIDAARTSTRRLVELVDVQLDTPAPGRSRDVGGDAGSAQVAEPSVHGTAGPDLADTLDPAFHARALGIATVMVADTALEAAGACPVGSRNDDRVRADRPRQIIQSLRSHLSSRSVWFRNALRGAVGLAVAVAIVEVTNVEHGFWVVLGTLSVLRSSALGTGSTALRAIGGTAAGFVIGSAIMVAVGGHSLILWLLLPIAVLVAGTAPSLISFAAGQAGFTLFVVILFNIIAPAGWRVGLTRIEDVTIGCAVSVVVGLLFWPRGATAALGHALSDAFDTASRFLADVVDRLTLPDREVDTMPASRNAASANLRLDDAFREFLGERGAKVVPVETIADLFTGANRIQMAAVTMASLPPVAVGEGSQLESVAVAGAVLRDAFALSHRWYAEFAELLADRRDRLDAPPEPDATLRHVLKDAYGDAIDTRRDDQARVVFRMIWADEVLQAQQQIQSQLAGAAETFVHMRRGRLMV